MFAQLAKSSTPKDGVNNGASEDRKFALVLYFKEEINKIVGRYGAQNHHMIKTMAKLLSVKHIFNNLESERERKEAEDKQEYHNNCNR